MTSRVGGRYPHPVVFPRSDPPRGCIFRFSPPRSPFIIPLGPIGRRRAAAPHNQFATEETGMAKKKVAFGGYAINFKGCSDSLEDIMGSKPIGPSEMTKRIWAYVKKKKLAKK